jgi:hypothetical protein
VNVATGGLLAQILPVGVLLLVLELRGLAVGTNTRISARIYVYQFISAALGAMSGLLCTVICVIVVWQDEPASVVKSIAVAALASVLSISVTQFVGAKLGSDQRLSDAMKTLSSERQKRKAAKQGRHEAPSS